MRLQIKFKQMSWKMKFSVVISAIWFLYWVFAGNTANLGILKNSEKQPIQGGTLDV